MTQSSFFEHWSDRHSRAGDESSSPAEVRRLHKIAGEWSSALAAVDDAAGAEIDARVAHVLEALANVLDADCTALLALRGDTLERAQTWCRPGQGLSDSGAARRVAWATETLTTGMELVGASAVETPARIGAHAATGVKSALVVPVVLASRDLYALAIGCIRERRNWTPAVLDQVRLIAETLTATVHRRHLDQILVAGRRAGRRGRVARQDWDDGDECKGLDAIVGHSPALQDPLERVRQVASTDSTVLLLGETGTGKELFADAIHARSRRAQRPFVRVNCAALSVSLIDSELFGHERGAFTGAASSRQGRFELANGGTLFLDEIGDLPAEVQVKLLRVLQEGEYERIGSSRTRSVDVRLISATHHNLEALVEAGKFRADLYYRISTFPITLPPLRQRADDIPHLVWHFIHRRQRALHRQITDVPPEVMAQLVAHSWPGNVRELQNVIERAMIRSTGTALTLDSWSNGQAGPAQATNGSLEAVAREHIVSVLDGCGWRINGEGNAAERLGLHPNTLRFRMKKFSVTRPVSSATAC